MSNEAISVEVPLGVYLELSYQLRNHGDTRQPNEVVAFALKAWLGSRNNRSSGSYQWKELSLPDGAELRMRYRGIFYYAKIDGDQLRYEGETVSPRSWARWSPAPFAIPGVISGSGEASMNAGGAPRCGAPPARIRRCFPAPIVACVHGA